MQQAPAKIILFGEHAVVYGQPAIAVPFTALHATVESRATPPGTGLTIIAGDVGQLLHVEHPLAGGEPSGNALIYAAQITLAKLKAPLPDLSLENHSTIPVASGLGSGAAVSTALIRELSAALGSPLQGDALNALVYEVEKMHHGTPSGIDNTVIVSGAPVYFVRGQAPQPFQIGTPLTLVVADSGIQASTRESVGAVRALYEQHTDSFTAYFEEIGALVNEARRHIETGNLKEVGQLMNRNHQLLNILTVSSPLLNSLTGAAREAGALGAKLSGGGRGGNVIALVMSSTADQVAEALRGAGAVRTWMTTVETLETA